MFLTLSTLFPLNTHTAKTATRQAFSCQEGFWGMAALLDAGMVPARAHWVQREREREQIHQMKAMLVPLTALKPNPNFLSVTSHRAGNSELEGQ